MRKISQSEIEIDQEFKSLIPPLAPDERSLLEQQIRKDGCREPLAVWKGWDVLLDGHNRYEICTENNVKFQTVPIDGLEDRTAAVTWIINNQLGKRNLSPEVIRYLRGRRYNLEKTAGHGAKTGHHNDAQLKTSEKLAAEYKVGKATIERDAKYATAIDDLTESLGDNFRQSVLRRESKIPAQDIVRLYKLHEDDPERAKNIGLLMLHKQLPFREAEQHVEQRQAKLEASTTSQESVEEEVESDRHNRVDNDFYPTAQQLTKALLAKVKGIQFQILEPCAGDGAIASFFDGVITNDLYPHPEFAPDYCEDATNEDVWQRWAKEGFDWVVTNPPYKAAPLILPLAFKYASAGVAFLLRLSYLEPCRDRANWLIENADHLRYFIPVSPRPKFRSDISGSDQVTVAWFVWQRNFSWAQLEVECPFNFITDWKNL